MADKTIGVSGKTHKRLEEFCGKGRTYDEAINDLLDLASKTIWDEREQDAE